MKIDQFHCGVNYIEHIKADLYHINCASDGGELFVEADASIAAALHKGDHVIFEGHLVNVRGVNFLERVLFIGYWGAQR